MQNYFLSNRWYIVICNSNPYTFPLFKLYHFVWVRLLIYSCPSFSMIVRPVYNYLKFTSGSVLEKTYLLYWCWKYCWLTAIGCSSGPVLVRLWILVMVLIYLIASDNMTWIPKFTIRCQYMALCICPMQMILSKHMGIHCIFLDAYKIYLYIVSLLSKLLAMSLAHELDC